MMRFEVTLVYVCLPLILAAPADDTLKQQISGLYRNDAGYWNMLAPGRQDPGRPLRRLEEAIQQHPGYGSVLQKKFDSLSGQTFGGEKRNFDEIDRAGFGSFVKKNFDEIDRSGFGFNKRNFDEIDHAGFGAFAKRSV